MKKPLLCFPTTSPGRGAKTCTLTGGPAVAVARLPVAAVAPAAAAAATATRAKVRKSFRVSDISAPLRQCLGYGPLAWSRQDRAGRARRPHGEPVRFSVRRGALRELRRRRLLERP